MHLATIEAIRRAAHGQSVTQAVSYSLRYDKKRSQLTPTQNLGRGARRRRALARRRPAPTGSDQSHEDDANRGVPYQQFDDTPLPKFANIPLPKFDNTPLPKFDDSGENEEETARWKSRWKSTVLPHFLQNLRNIQSTTDVKKLQTSLNLSLARALHVYGDHTALLADTGIPPLSLIQ